MRLVLRCLIGSFILTLVISGWILFVPPGSGIAFALLFPAFWLTSTVMGPTIATSESGPTNFITVVLASSILMSSCTRPSSSHYSNFVPSKTAQTPKFLSLTLPHSASMLASCLETRGIPDRHISSALEEVAQTSDEAAMVRQRIERKLRSYRGEIDEKKMASMYGSLLRAGFSADVVRRELRALTREEVPDAEAEME